VKRVIQRTLFHLGTALGPCVIRLLGLTWRVRWIGCEYLEVCRAKGAPVIHTFWHGRMLALTYSHRNQGIGIMISRHNDGEIIQRITAKLGFGAVRGSTGKGGGRAILGMVRHGKKGLDIAITPDGPRGPRCVAQLGVVMIAQRSGLPVLPLAAAAVRRKVFGSWDRFQAPAPFSRVMVGYGPPIYVPPDAGEDDLEQYRLQVEGAVRKLTDDLDELCGHEREFG